MSNKLQHEEAKKSKGSNKTAQEGESTYPIAFDPEVHELLAQLHQGQSDPLYALVSRTTGGRVTEASAEELQVAREELLGVIDTVDPGMAEGITKAVMDIDEKLAGSGNKGELGDVLDDTMSSLDEFFKGGKKRAQIPDMYSKGGIEYIRVKILEAAQQMGAPATPEQVHAQIDKAAQEVASEMATSLPANIKAVVDTLRESLYTQLTKGAKMPAPEAKPSMGPAVPPAPGAQPPLPSVPQPPVEPIAASRRAKMSQSLREAFDKSYAYDALAIILEAELGPEFPKTITADEVIDEEEAFLDLAEQSFENVERKELVEAFGELLTDIYSKAE